MRALLLLAILAHTLSALAQQPDVINPAARSIAMAVTLPAYDVISIHQSKDSTEDSSLDTTGDGVIIQNASLLEIIEYAYGLASFDLISGVSGPASDARFDIRAKITNSDGDRPVKLKDEQLQAMLIPLLADRFHLRVRLVIKKLDVYRIVVAKGGPKFTLTGQTVAPGAVNVTFSRNYNVLTLKHSSISTLAGVLSDCGLHHLVADRTSLTGNGDMTLRWSPDEAFEQGGSSLITIFAAMQDQLGLKIVTAKLPVDTLVIDHAEMPTEN